MHPLAARSWKVFPAGSNGEFNLPADLGTVLARGQGCEVWDVTGRRFLDFSMGWGSVLVGHARPEVVAAVVARALLGSNFAYVNEESLLLGEELVRLSPACETVRFCASGTEATMYCARLARAFTGRDKILKFEGAYHGANDVGVASLFPQSSPDYPRPDSTCAGAAEQVKASMLVAPYNDLATARRTIAVYAAELAAVIVEPLQRCTPPVEGYVAGLRDACSAHDVLLVFDEVVTGFRLAYGGAQEYYGVTPDLVAYGKALGGGYPIGAFGGRREVMQVVEESRLGDDARYVWVASTLGGNPISCAASRAALEVLRETDVYPRLHHLGHYLREGLRREMRDAGVTGHAIGDGPLGQIVLCETSPTDYRGTQRGDRARQRAIMLELFAAGVFLNPMGTKLYLSLAHDESACEELLAHFAQALRATS